MEEKRKNIEGILDQFGREEMGNRLSQFSLIALKNLILMEFDKKQEEKKTDGPATGKI